MKIHTLIVAGVLLCAGVSCSSAGKQEDAGKEWHVVSKPSVEEPVAVRMPPSDVTTRFRLQGRDCEAQVFRTPDDALPVVKNEEGDQFVDNRITIRITEGQGRRLFERTFTKQSFAAFLSDRFMQEAILEGIAYDTVDGSHVCFAASVSYPESDLYVPLRLRIGADGTLAVEETDLMDDAYTGAADSAR